MSCNGGMCLLFVLVLFSLLFVCVLVFMLLVSLFNSLSPPLSLSVSVSLSLSLRVLVCAVCLRPSASARRGQSKPAPDIILMIIFLLSAKTAKSQNME